MTYRNASSNALAALADPTRRAIFERLAARPSAVGPLAKDLPVSRPAVSQHLRVLRAAGLISTNGDLLAADYPFSFFRYFGDSDGDRDVDFADFFAFARTYGLSTGNTNFNAEFDYNADGRVDATDLTNFQAHYLTVLITASVPVIPGAATNRTTLTLRAANPAGYLFSFATLPGIYYKLQSTPSLDQPFADEPGGFIQAVQTLMTLTNQPSGPSRFYRVVESATP